MHSLNWLDHITAIHAEQSFGHHKTSFLSFAYAAAVKRRLITLANHRGMIRLFISLLALAGCNLPSAEYRGLAPTRVTVQGSTFDIRQRGTRAEAIRINPEYAPRFGPIRERAGMAMAMVSGCKVVSVTGDQAQAFGRLNCGKGTGPKRVKPLALDCVPVRGSGIPEIGQIRVDLDCDPA